MRTKACLAIDLRDDAEAIAHYESLHRPGGVWPEVMADLRAHGYAEMTIWRTGNRLFMIVEIDAVEPPATDAATQIILDRWQTLTSSLQQALPGTGPQPRWIPMDCVFDLKEHSAGATAAQKSGRAE